MTVETKVLTSARLLFLSVGGSGAGRRLLVSATLGPIGSLLWGQTPTQELDLSGLDAEGSIAIGLPDITDHTANRRCDCAGTRGPSIPRSTRPSSTEVSTAHSPRDTSSTNGVD